MPSSPKSARKAASRIDRTPQRRTDPIPRLTAETACDTAFRMIARRLLGELTANHEGACKGGEGSVHRMRIALTGLRTAITFFSPMVADSQRAQIREELKWLNGHLGAIRDLDVAISELRDIDKRRPQAIPFYRAWRVKRANSHRHLAQVLRSVRYTRLIKSTSDWVEHGPWSIKTATHAASERASPIALYGARKLTRWRKRLLEKSRKLWEMSTKKRHRLRLLNKKLCYSIGFFRELFPDERVAPQQAALKYLRKAQRSLGRLNDDANSQALAVGLQREGVKVPSKILNPKREKRLLRTAAAAYQKLAALEAF
jgi:CHAD domain-containing protein